MNLKEVLANKIIQPLWAMEENVRINLKLVWLIPLQAPTKEERIAIKGKIKRLEKEANKNKGAIFCHVIKITSKFHFIFFETCGNQKWKGTAPIFIHRALKIILELKSKNNIAELQEVLREKIIRSVEAKA
jgi:hypothetical protein